MKSFVGVVILVLVAIQTSMASGDCNELMQEAMQTSTEASAEFLSRIEFLLARHLITVDDVKRMISSSTPVFKFSKNASAKENLEFLPHRRSLLKLLRHPEKLDWDLIRDRLEYLTQTEKEKTERSQDNSKQTKEAAALIPVKFLKTQGVGPDLGYVRSSAAGDLGIVADYGNPDIFIFDPVERKILHQIKLNSNVRELSKPVEFKARVYAAAFGNNMDLYFFDVSKGSILSTIDLRDEWQKLNPLSAGNSFQRPELFTEKGALYAAWHGFEGYVLIFDVLKGVLFKTIKQEEILLEGKIFSSNGLGIQILRDQGHTYFISTFNRSRLGLWALDDEGHQTQILKVLEDHDNAIQIVNPAVFREGHQKLLIARGAGSNLYFIEPFTGKMIHEMESGEGLAFKPAIYKENGRTMAIVGVKGGVKIVDLSTRKAVREILTDTGWGPVTLVNHQGRTWGVAADDSGHIHLFDLVAGRIISSFSLSARTGSLSIRPVVFKTGGRLMGMIRTEQGIQFFQVFGDLDP